MYKRIMKTILLLLPFVIRSSQGQVIQFAREKITVEVQKDRCVLVGEYLFRNSSDRLFQGSLYYPVSKTHSPLPHYFKVTEACGMLVSFTLGKDGIVFPILVAAHDSSRYRVEYHQRTPDHFFEYILTTTKFWNQRLVTADFLIRVPEEFHLLSLSMKSDKSIKTEKGITYYIHREAFLPEENLTLSWEVR